MEENATEYQGPERRRTAVHTMSEAQVALMIEEEVDRRVGKFEERMMLHMDGKFAQLHRLISDAFPDGDPHGHRMYHERQIKDADGWDKMKADILSKFLSSGLWVAAGWLAYAVWQSFKNEVQK
ncbi:MAG: hypothetical protein RL758_357 [Pseudomonadota bacterium]|jgi:hypothetical protein